MSCAPYQGQKKDETDTWTPDLMLIAKSGQLNKCLKCFYIIKQFLYQYVITNVTDGTNNKLVIKKSVKFNCRSVKHE